MIITFAARNKNELYTGMKFPFSYTREGDLTSNSRH